MVVKEAPLEQSYSNMKMLLVLEKSNKMIKGRLTVDLKLYWKGQ